MAKWTSCGCKACKKMKRKGKILGTRRMGYWDNNEFAFGPVSDYVNFPRFSKGKREKRANRSIKEYEYD